MRFVLGPFDHDLADRALVMGVVPGGGPRDPAGGPGLDACCRHAERLVHGGADVLEVGSREAPPGPAVSAEEEIDRVAPVIRALRERFGAPVVCATGRAVVVVEALRSGAVAVRDGTGSAGADYLTAAAQAGASVLVAPPAAALPANDDVERWRRSLAASAGRARAAGLPAERILLDGGLDRVASPARALLLRRSTALAGLGHGLVLSWDGEDRAETVAAWVVGIMAGWRVLRTADSRSARRVADVLDGLAVAGEHR